MKQTMKCVALSRMLALGLSLAVWGCAQSGAGAPQRNAKQALVPRAEALPKPAAADKVPSSLILKSRQPVPSQPFTISRVFAPGDIRQLAKAVVGGQEVETQCDVMTRWPDGSLQHAMLSFWAALPAGDTVVEFVNQPAPPEGKPLDADRMLSGDFDFGGVIEITNKEGKALSADARAMLEAGAFRYWLRGPICTQVIIEDPAPERRFDLGWDSHRSFHPIFVATFYPRWRGVKVEMIGENMWTEFVQDLSYALALKTGPPAKPAAVYTKDLFTHFALTRWRKVFWSGAEPRKVNIDFNLPYLIQSRVVPNFDLTRSVPGSVVQDVMNWFRRTDRGDINGSGMWMKAFPTTGGRPELGLFPSWAAQYLYTFDENLFDVLIANGGVSGHTPIHLRESAKDRTYLRGTGYSAVNRPVSVDARPTFTFLNLTFSETNPRDRITIVGPLSWAHGWEIDLAHQGSFGYLPYLFTGDWYFLEETYFWGSFNVAHNNPSSQVSYGRGGSYGFINAQGLQIRGVAWGMRNLGHAAFLAPDGSAEKAYFTDKMYHNIAVREGEQNIAGGAFYDPSPNSPWTWGRTMVGGARANPLRFLTRTYLEDRAGMILAEPPDGAAYVDSPWMYNFCHVVFGHLEELGFPIGPYRRVVALNLLHQLANPAYNPYLSAAYRMPAVRASDGQFFTDWGAVLKAFMPNFRTVSGWPHGDEADVENGYPATARAAASFLVGINDGNLKGEDAWNWMNKAFRRVDAMNNNPKWALAPRKPGQLDEAWARKVSKMPKRTRTAANLRLR